MDQTKRFRELLPQLVESYSVAPSADANSITLVEPHSNSPLSIQLYEGIQGQIPIAAIEQAESHDQRR